MKILLSVMIVMQVATMFFAFAAMIEAEEVDRRAMNIGIEWEIHKQIFCDTIAKEHPLCTWRRKQLNEN